MALAYRNQNMTLRNRHQENKAKSPALSSAPNTDSAVSATQRVADDLRTRIIRGQLPPGEKLKVESLKTLLNVGASPIREALSLLTSDQLVERIDQRGFRVAPVSATHFHEILMLRCKLDDIALRGSIEQGQADWEDKLVLAHHHLAKVPTKHSDQYEAVHKDFHTTLLSACNSPILLRFCYQLYDLNIRYRYLAGKSVRYGKRNIAREHKNILDAAIQRDADTASTKLIEHYTLTGEFLSDQFN